MPLLRYYDAASRTAPPPDKLRSRELMLLRGADRPMIAPPQQRDDVTGDDIPDKPREAITMREKLMRALLCHSIIAVFSARIAAATAYCHWHGLAATPQKHLRLLGIPATSGRRQHLHFSAIIRISLLAQSARLAA